MKVLPFLALSATMSAAVIFTAASAQAQQRPAYGPRFSPRPAPSTPFNGIFPGVYVYEREVPVIVEREVVVREVPVAPPAPPPPPRKPYVIGGSYSSLPGGCMKLIEEGISYYHCSGEWYREVRGGRDPLYRAVKRQL